LENTVTVAVLKVLEGSVPGQILELTEDRMVLGRHPKCQIVLDNAAVSRHHAQVLENHGVFYVEDLRSRNGTFLNDTAVSGRTEIKDQDKITVCDIIFQFYLQMPKAEESTTFIPSTNLHNQHAILDDQSSIYVGNQLEHSNREIDLAELIEENSSGPSARSSIISKYNVSSGSSLRLDVQPEAKLRAIFEISNSLGESLTIDEILPKILDTLFRLFTPADEGFILLKKPESNKLQVKAVKNRHSKQTETAPVSTTILKQALRSGEAILSADAAHDARFKSSESLSNFRIHSVMCVPLMSKNGDALGVIQLDTRDTRHQFSQEDLDLLVSVATQATIAIENANLLEAVLKQRDLERDMDFATQVQLGFLPNERPQVPNYEFYDFYESALSVGGDYFDYIQLPDGRVGVTIGDVAGKGVPAALLMARLYSSARYQLLTKLSAAEALSGLNSEIASSGVGYRFITFVMAIIDPVKNEIAIANAGHLAPVIRSANGETHSMGKHESGMPLGIVREQTYKESKLPFEAGDSLVMFTDGITEAMDHENEMYNKHRVEKYIEQGPTEIKDLIKGIVADVESFCQGRSQRDDMCLVGFQRT